MTITYDDLRARIGERLGYGYAKSNWSGTAQKVELVERILKSGLSRFADPVCVNGQEKHMWSFLTPTLTIHLESGKYAYDLPSYFVSFESPLHPSPGSSDFYPTIEIIGADEVQRRLAMSDDQGAPSVAGVRVKHSQPIGQTVWELIIHPVPDATYDVKAATKINPTLPGADDAVPLGGQPHEQTLIEACLAECELFDEIPSNTHHIRFLECLASSISHDRRVTGAKNLGYNGDPSSRRWESHPWCDSMNIPFITYNGALVD